MEGYTAVHYLALGVRYVVFNVVAPSTTLPVVSKHQSYRKDARFRRRVRLNC